MPSISVIVPVYKVENYLHRCVDSILAQSFSDFELILVDDGSPDRCGAICEEYAAKHPQIHVIHRENGGLSAARNSGIDWAIANSDSQWLTFIDSDDWVHPEYLASLYSIAQKTGCHLSACSFYVTEGEEIPQNIASDYQCISADDYYCAEPKSGNIPTIACAKLYYKTIFNTLRYPEGKLHEDEFTTYKAVYAVNRVGVTTAQLYAYYQNPQSITRSQWSSRRMHILEAFEQQIAYAKEYGRDGLYKKAVKNYVYSIHEQLTMAEKKYHGKLREKYRQALRYGRQSGVFPVQWKNLWAYEEAYPAKLFWWPLFKGKAMLDKLPGRRGR